MTFTAELPMPPSSNNLFATFRGKDGKERRIITRDYKAWRKEAESILFLQWMKADQPTIGKPFSVHIELNLNHQSDICNREKPLVDLFVKTIPGFPDDCWANRVLIERNREIKAARVEVVTLPLREA